MQSSQLFFLFILVSVSFPISHVYAVSVTAQVFGTGEVGFEDDEIILDNDSTLDLSDTVTERDETIQLVGGQNVTLTQQATIGSSGDFVKLVNTQLPTVEVNIPDSTIIFGDSAWNKEIIPPKNVAVTGTVSSAFITPTSAILIGSPDVVLVFDRAVTIFLEDTTGQTAYKLPGQTSWTLISTCGGTFDNPNDPPANGECSISDDTDTKILTFHFTHFTGLSTPAPSTPSTPSSPGTSGGGHGNTGVGSPRIFGPSSSGGSSGGGVVIQTESGPRVFPGWFDEVKDWYRMGDISAIEFLNAYQWIIENIMK